jgi:hypothetical protein
MTTKISAMGAATTPLAGTELLELVQGGSSTKVAASDVGNSADALPFASLAGRAYADFYDTTDQTGATAAGVEVQFNTTVLNTGITMVNNGGAVPTRLTFAEAGKYRVRVELQAANSAAADHVITTWVRINGTDVVGTALKTVVAKTGDGGVEGIVREWVLTVTAAQYATIMWLVDNVVVTLDTTTATAGPPAIPAFASARVTAERIV